MTHIEKARAYRAKIEEMAQHMPEEAAIAAPTLFPLWTQEWRGVAGSIVRDNGYLFRSIHDVTNAGQNTRPSQTPAMWTRIGDPGDEWPEWIRPIGAHDAYPAGAQVTHNGHRWTNIHGNGNVWEPGVFGWEKVGS